ncbi:MAG: hypothetical protein ISS74_06790 [Planctomycetes bacterium]|nr:hypothetical protein [Planctomycetota bacterium]
MVMVAVLVGLAWAVVGPGPTARAGTIVAWGDNTAGQCYDPGGNPYTAGYPFPTGDDFIAISAGSQHGLALRSDGAIVAWGNTTVIVGGGGTLGGYGRVANTWRPCRSRPHWPSWAWARPLRSSFAGVAARRPRHTP